MLYQVARDYLTQSVEAELIRLGYRDGLGQILVELHLDERFYKMPVQIDLAAQHAVLAQQHPPGELIERLAHAVEFEDLTDFGGILRVFARTLLNRAGISDILRGQAAPDAGLRRHIIPRVSRVLDAMTAALDHQDLTNYDTLLAVIEAAAMTHVDQDGPQGFLAQDLSTIEALRREGVGTTAQAVGDVAQLCGLQGWVKWTRGLYSGIRWLSEVSEMDLERFRATVQASIDGAEGGPLGLGGDLAGSVQEMGLALAMSFFGDLGNPQFAKPDRHVVRALRAYDGARLSARQAFERLVLHSNQAGVSPRELDKVLYLAGSGNFYLTGFIFGPKFKAGFLERLQREDDQAPFEPQPIEWPPRAAAREAEPPTVPHGEDPAGHGDEGQEIAAELNFFERLDGSLAALTLVDRLDALCDEEQAEVHYTHAAGGDLRVRADRPEPRPRVQNVTTIVWRRRIRHFACQVFAAPDECVELGFPEEQITQQAGPLETGLTVRPGIDDEAFLQIVARSIQRFRGL